ncbi:hypothetical protein LEMLEM_LOCUS5731, partial [Lemmus lemmus]
MAPPLSSPSMAPPRLIHSAPGLLDTCSQLPTSSAVAETMSDPGTDTPSAIQICRMPPSSWAALPYPRSRDPDLGTRPGPCLWTQVQDSLPGPLPGSFSRSPPWTSAYPPQGCSPPCCRARPARRLLPPASGCIPRAAAAILRNLGRR